MRWLSAATIALGTFAAAVAHAEPRAEDRGTALALFNQARELMEKGDDASACPKLEEAERLAPGVGIEFNLGDCYEKIGRLASAWSMFQQAAIAARGAGQRERDEASRARAIALEPRLSRLVILVPKENAIDGLVVKRDGREIGRAQWGEPITVDTGDHVVSAEAPASRRWETTVRVAGERAQVSTTIPLLGKDDATPAPVPLVLPAPAQERPRAGLLRPVGIGVAAAGLAGLATWGVLGALAIKRHGDAAGHCSTIGGATVCDADGQGPNDAAVDLAHGATVALVAGSALLVAGAIMILVAPSSARSSPKSGPSVTPVVGLGEASVRASWAW